MTVTFDRADVLKTFEISNYKSIEQMTLELGRVNVLIGENGAGKSNILEAMALAGAARAGKLDNEFLASRGIRAVSPKLMRSAFENEQSSDIMLSTKDTNEVTQKVIITNDDAPYSSWKCRINQTNPDNDINKDTIRNAALASLGNLPEAKQIEVLDYIIDNLKSSISQLSGSSNALIDYKNQRPEAVKFFSTLFPKPNDSLSDFVVYSPENSAMRLFEHESQIYPLGIRGEGLLKLLTVMESDPDRTQIDRIKSALCMLGWFTDYSIVQENLPRMDITDRFLADGVVFDQRSANEGFLYIAFYLALFCSNLTPDLFAIDNIDASLNPKLCRAMIQQLTKLARDNNKQVILTTHNPAVLDGLNLNDDEQRLFVVERDLDGRTRVVRKFKPRADGKPRKLSELFMAGAIGGLPVDF